MHFKDLDGKSRVWIYQANRKLTAIEVDEIENLGRQFITHWTAHGSELHAAFHTFYDRFLVLFADETQVEASGCSIDSSVRFIKNIEQQYQLDLFDRLTIAYKQNDEIKTIKLSEFEEALKSGEINENSIVFNNLITTKNEFENSWLLPIKESWHSKFIG